jgi:hypothetical protein
MSNRAETVEMNCQLPLASRFLPAVSGCRLTNLVGKIGTYVKARRSDFSAGEPSRITAQMIH